MVIAGVAHRPIKAARSAGSGMTLVIARYSWDTNLALIRHISYVYNPPLIRLSC